MNEKPDWSPFKKVTNPFKKMSMANVKLLAKEYGLSNKKGKALWRSICRDKYFINSLYQVYAGEVNTLDGGSMYHLTIKKTNLKSDEPISWSDKQRIKNEVVGEGYEAVELFPTQDRVIESPTQCHLWVLPDHTFRFPFGFFKGDMAVEEKVGDIVSEKEGDE